MISEKLNKREEGFLLLDSLATLAIIMAIILFISPLLVDWLSQREKAKDSVEASRAIYEKSMELNSQQNLYLNEEEYFLNVENDHPKNNALQTGVTIYEKKFKYE